MSISKLAFLLLTLFFIAGTSCYAEVQDPISFVKNPPWIANITAGRKAYEQAHYADAIRSLRLAQKQIEEFTPKEQMLIAFKDGNLGLCLNILSLSYAAQGKYTDAEPLCRQSLELAEKTLGSDSTAVAAQLSNLAEIYRAIGKNSEVEALFKRAISITEKTSGKDSLQVAQFSNNLASWYDETGRESEGIKLLERVLAIYESKRGPNDPLVALTLSNMAQVYIKEKNYDKAVSLSKRALAIYEKTLPKDHPQIAACLNGLGIIEQTNKNYDKAEEYYKRTIAMKERLFGTSHPSLIVTLTNLAELYNAQGKVIECGEIYKRVTSIQLAVHQQGTVIVKTPNVLPSLKNNPGSLTQIMNRAAKSGKSGAKPQDRSGATKPQPTSLARSFPPNIKQIVDEYARADKSMKDGDLNAAQQAAQKGLQLLKGHKDIMGVGLYSIMSSIELQKRNFAQASQYAGQAVTIAESVEPKGIICAQVLIQQGQIYQWQLQFQLAEPAFAKAVNILENNEKARQKDKALQEQFIAARKSLFASLVAQSKDKEASAVLTPIFQDQSRPISDCDYPLTIASGASQVGDLYYAAGKTSEAQKFYEKSIKLYYDNNDKCPGVVGAHNTVTPFPSIISAMRKLGDIYEKSGRDEEGKKLKKDADDWAMLRQDK
jgi:tetratricopeptide (TPR) repeat protein